MLSFTSTRPVVSGGIYPKIFPIILWSVITITNGLTTTLGKRLIRRFASNSEKKSGRNEDPSAGIIDSQSVKGTPESAKESGIDGHKLVKGRKRHIVVDTMGYLIVVLVHAANIYDGRAAPKVLSALFSVVDTIQKIWADNGYKSEELIQWVKEQFGCVLEIVQNKKTPGTFQVVPRRWVVERTFAWLGRSRRLSKDYERKPTSSAGHVYVSSSRLMLRRICKVRALSQEAILAAV